MANWFWGLWSFKVQKTQKSHDRADCVFFIVKFISLWTAHHQNPYGSDTLYIKLIGQGGILGGIYIFKVMGQEIEISVFSINKQYGPTASWNRLSFLHETLIFYETILGCIAERVNGEEWTSGRYRPEVTWQNALCAQSIWTKLLEFWSLSMDWQLKLEYTHKLRYAGKTGDTEVYLQYFYYWWSCYSVCMDGCLPILADFAQRPSDAWLAWTLPRVLTSVVDGVLQIAGAGNATFTCGCHGNKNISVAIATVKLFFKQSLTIN